MIMEMNQDNYHAGVHKKWTFLKFLDYSITYKLNITTKQKFYRIFNDILLKQDSKTLFLN